MSVLWVAHTRLSLGYLLDHHCLLAGDPRLTFAIARAGDDYAAGLDATIDRLGIPRLPYCVALRRPWDVAVFATHGSEIFFRHARARVHIQHGLGAGKLVDGQDFTYGPKWALWDGAPKYDRMLEASYQVAARAIATCPPLEDRIAVVGDLRADELAAAEDRRLYHRRRLGIAPDETAVVMVSTFGPHGMVGRYGWGYVDAALAGPHKVMLCLHPHLWTGRHDHRATVTASLASRVEAGLVVCGPGERFVPYLAAADVAVIDHSSLGLYWSLLARPTVAIPVPNYAVNLAAPIAALRASSPLAATPGCLPRALDEALTSFDPNRFAPYRASLVAWPGRAAERATAVLYELLGVSIPAKAA